MSVANLEGCGRVEEEPVFSASFVFVNNDADVAARARFALAATRRAAQASARLHAFDVRMACTRELKRRGRLAREEEEERDECALSLPFLFLE